MKLLEYWDYREFLSDYYKSQKAANRFYSYRFMGNKLEIEHGYLIRILQGKFHLSNVKIPLVIKHCKFNQKEAEYFEHLVQFGKAKNAAETRLHFEKLLSFKEAGARQIEVSQYEFYKE